MGTVKEIDPRAAQQALVAGDGAVFLDVRSQAEFATGHVPGALNIPLYDLDADGRMAPNHAFPHVIDAVISRTARVIVGCKVGQRSAQAAEFITSMGYEDVYNLAGGLHGLSGFMGQVGAPGWIGCGLPVAHEPVEGASYLELKARADQT